MALPEQEAAMDMLPQSTQSPRGTSSCEDPARSTSRITPQKIRSRACSKAFWICIGCIAMLLLLLLILVLSVVLYKTLWPHVTLHLTNTLVPSSRPRSHSYRYFYTGVSDPSPDVPAFTAVGYVDDQQILHYNSKTQRQEPRGDWVQGAVDPGFWDKETRALHGWQEGFDTNLATLRYRYNQTGGSHTLQFTYGCELHEDSSTGGHMQWCYNGGDFISYDPGTRTWVAGTTQAQRTQHSWNEDQAVLQRTRAYLEGTCIARLQQYLQRGEAALRSKRPVAQASKRPSQDGRTTLSCHVHSFYPKDISVVWLDNGEAQTQETSRSEVLPSGDGTYQTWATIKIDQSSKHDYTCSVEHVSLGAALKVSWDKGRTEYHWKLIVGIIIGVVLILVIAVMGAACYFFKRRRKQQRSTRDQGGL
ncbi:major histocompatibility complex class I-related gene protein isoform X2 [Alligator mississippiensis]|nr:major histocompatibility complex class I-related gene protein isoform X2 [Alligator mississippiensis]XP_059581572.1 major histocompatibility complex class I-related gene protein isoform X2 [Alligator mississippiensis]XP_059581573.1 major histocompatibility complex class I-related gene protein isoform X2 [Alligator mississippiensis]XP_059581574.1 major histocompatibility complex class I-related gene protein isoform X2 [Alligator mississippiensis]XP_059581575.1 major histocompatibility complex